MLLALDVALNFFIPNLEVHLVNITNETRLLKTFSIPIRLGSVRYITSVKTQDNTNFSRILTTLILVKNLCLLGGASAIKVGLFNYFTNKKAKAVMGLYF